MICGSKQTTVDRCGGDPYAVGRDSAAADGLGGLGGSPATDRLGILSAGPADAGNAAYDDSDGSTTTVGSDDHAADVLASFEGDAEKAVPAGNITTTVSPAAFVSSA